MNDSSRRKKLVFFINHLSFFCSHRMPIAIKAIQNNYDVHLIVGKEPNNDEKNVNEQKIKSHGIVLHRSTFAPSFKNIFSEISGFIKAYLITKKINPDIIHTASPKGNLYGGMIAKLLKIKALVISISGMGYIFTDTKKIRIIIFRELYKKLLLFILSHENFRLIVQNADDKEIFTKQLHVPNEQISLIEGSGIELNNFKNIDFAKKDNLVVMPSRLLYSKGIKEYVAAASTLKKKYPDWDFCVAGSIKYDSPDAVHISEIEQWKRANNVTFLGFIKDIEKLLKRSSIVCLPSYREGFPKCLMEAAASGNAIVTSNITGCRDAVLPNETALLVEVGEVNKLIESIKYLIENNDIREQFGKAGISHATRNFDIGKVVRINLSIYDRLLTK